MGKTITRVAVEKGEAVDVYTTWSSSAANFNGPVPSVLGTGHQDWLLALPYSAECSEGI